MASGQSGQRIIDKMGDSHFPTDAARRQQRQRHLLIVDGHGEAEVDRRWMSDGDLALIQSNAEIRSGREDGCAVIEQLAIDAERIRRLFRRLVRFALLRSHPRFFLPCPPRPFSLSLSPSPRILLYPISSPSLAENVFFEDRALGAGKSTPPPIDLSGLCLDSCTLSYLTSLRPTIATPKHFHFFPLPFGPSLFLPPLSFF